MFLSGSKPPVRPVTKFVGPGLDLSAIGVRWTWRTRICWTLNVQSPPVQLETT